MAQYKAGDHVRIVSEWRSGCYQNYAGLMDHWLGAIMTIKSYNGGSYQTARVICMMMPKKHVCRWTPLPHLTHRD